MLYKSILKNEGIKNFSTLHTPERPETVVAGLVLYVKTKLSRH